MNRSILRELAKDTDYQVTVAAPRLFKGSLRTIECEPEPEGSKIHLVKLDAYMTQKMHIFSYDHFQLKKLFSKNFDMVHAWEEPYIFAGYQVASQAHKSKTPYAFRTAQSLVKKYIYPFSRFEKKSFSWAKQWIAGGHLVFQTMVDKGLNSDQGQVLTLAVDTSQFKPFDDLQKKKVRDQLKLQGPVIGYLGRLSEEKGCDLFMEALQGLKDKPWNFLVMGSGPYKEKIERWAKEQDLQDRVQVRLFAHSEVPKVLPVCDLLICPSQTRPFWKEQFGRMVVEAFASGVPVMASNSGEIPRVVDKAGVILPEADALAWKKAMAEFLDQPESFQKYRELGLERVTRYSAASIAEKYKEFYQKLAGVK
ncbi:MAG: glycosyltransferase [Bdellovibrionales bacterium]|nr:glycosyltransferase [Bdellovibrionales bacterium]